MWNRYIKKIFIWFTSPIVISIRREYVWQTMNKLVLIWNNRFTDSHTFFNGFSGF